MHYIKCSLIIFAVCIILWFVCKWLNFSIIPKSFVIPRANPQTFKLPTVKRSESGEIIVESYDDSESDSEDDESSSESGDDYSSESSEDSEDSESDDNFY